MSELDSLSDSDWLDVSSNRESDDNDSVISGDSDGDEPGLVPLSRRSSVSIGSSREGDVEAWEGFVDDSGDEEPRNIESGMHIATMTTEIDKYTTGTSLLVTSTNNDPAEEQRVREALDQSLISTLSASRSGSTHNSLRDLRLSFPDPLTSSHDELNRSYEDVSPSETTFTTTDGSTEDVIDAPDIAVGLSAVPLCEGDPGSFVATPEVTEHEVLSYPGDNKARFEVVLYGSPSPIKWSFVQDLMQRATMVSDRTLTSTIVCANGSTRYLHLEYQAEHSNISEFIVIHDRTNDMILDPTVPQVAFKNPTLAILYLPSAIQSLPEHTLYLPVLLPPTTSTELDLNWIMAQDDWNSFAIPEAKIARLNRETDSPIFDSRNVENIHHITAHHLLQRLSSEGKKRSRIISEHLTSVHAATLFALLSLIVGFAMNTVFCRSSTPTPTIGTSASRTLWGMFGPEVNRTSVSAITARVTPGVSTPYKDFSLSIFNPATTSLTITSHGQQGIVSISATPEVIHCGPSTGIDKVRPATDVMIKPATQLSVNAQPSMTTMLHRRKAEGLSRSKSTSLSLVVESLSEVLDIRVKSIRNDLDELVESLDELARAIRRQTKIGMQQSKGKAQEIRENIQYRHDRARGKAKELRKRGEEIIMSASEQFTGRTNIAQKKARDISNSLMNSDVWRVYQAAHAEWVSRLKEKDRERGACRNRKGKRGKGSTVEQSNNFLSYVEVYLA